jgi:hypothetical protein
LYSGLATWNQIVFLYQITARGPGRGEDTFGKQF